MSRTEGPRRICHVPKPACPKVCPKRVPSLSQTRLIADRAQRPNPLLLWAAAAQSRPKGNGRWVVPTLSQGHVVKRLWDIGTMYIYMEFVPNVPRASPG